METGNSKYDDDERLPGGASGKTGLGDALQAGGDSFDVPSGSSKMNMEENGTQQSEPFPGSKVGEDEQLSAWEASSKAIAEKVQRQQ